MENSKVLLRRETQIISKPLTTYQLTTQVDCAMKAELCQTG
jgi:hypothetical protein